MAEFDLIRSDLRLLHRRLDDLIQRAGMVQPQELEPVRNLVVIALQRGEPDHDPPF